MTEENLMIIMVATIVFLVVIAFIMFMCLCYMRDQESLARMQKLNKMQYEDLINSLK